MSYEASDDDWYTYIGLTTGAGARGSPGRGVGRRYAGGRDQREHRGRGVRLRIVRPAAGESNELLLDQAAIDAERARDGVGGVSRDAGALLVGGPGSSRRPARLRATSARCGPRTAGRTSRTPASTSPTKRGRPSMRRRAASSRWRNRATLYGNLVIIDHGVGIFTAYAHLQQSVVTAGQTVQQSELIGYMGATGFVTGAAPALGSDCARGAGGRAAVCACGRP